MAKPAAPLLFLVLLAAAAFARTEADLKMDAVGAAIANLTDLKSVSMDNFILNGTQEYVIASANNSPAFLLKLRRDNASANFTAALVRDNATIRSVIEARYANLAPVDAQGARKAADEGLVSFEDSRYFYEAKYDLFFGLENGTCAGRNECRQACNRSVVCAYAYAKQGEPAIDDMMEYVRNKQDMDGQVARAKNLSAGMGNMSEAQAMQAYGEIISILQNASSRMASSNVQNGDNILYSGKIAYDTASLNSAMAAVRAVQGPLTARQAALAAWQDIQQTTAQLAPAPPAYGADAAQNQSASPAVKSENAALPTGDNASASPGAQNGSTDKIVIVERPVYQRDFFALENIVVVIAAVLLLLALIEGGKRAVRYLRERRLLR